MAIAGCGSKPLSCSRSGGGGGATPSSPPTPLHRVTEASPQIAFHPPWKAIALSVYVSSAVWKNPRIGGSRKLVLLKLADLADDSGENAWPSAETIARECGVGLRTVYRLLDGLEADGYLDLQHPANTVHRSATYRVIPDPCQIGNGVILAPLPSETPTPAMVATDPLLIRPSLSSYTPLPPLEGEQVIRLGRLHALMRTRVLGGINAPDSGWCEDLIRRGATDTDIEEAVDQTANRNIKGHGAFKYARAVLLRRVEEREAGRDPDAERSTGAGRSDRDGVPGQAQRGGFRVVGAGRAPRARVQGFDSSHLPRAIGEDDEDWYREHPEDRPTAP